MARVPSIEQIAAAFHDAHQRLGPRYGRREPRVPYSRLSPAERLLLEATIRELLNRGIISRPIS